MKRGLIIVGVLLVATLAYCQDFFFPYTWHQKMTLEVEVDGQLYTGASISQVSVGKSDPVTSQLGSPLQKSGKGEAAYVELPERQYLFALLDGGQRGSDFKNIAINLFRDQLPKRGLELFGALSRLRMMREVPHKYYPLLVTFTDINDPTSVKKVEPEKLEEAFGPGVSLKRITLAITDEPVTEGKIEKVLGWWLEQGTDRLDPPPFHVPNDSPRGYDTLGITQFIKSR